MVEENTHEHHSPNHEHCKHHHPSKSKFSKFYHKNKKSIKAIIVIIFCLIISVSIALFGEFFLTDSKPLDNISASKNKAQISSDKYDDFIYIGIPNTDKEIFLVCNAAKAYLSSDISTPFSSIIDDYFNKGRLDAGLPVILNFDLGDSPENITVNKAEVEISEFPDFSSSRIIPLNEDYSVEIYNLKTGCKYYYHVIFKLSNGLSVNSGGTFYTAETPRLMNVEGVHNMRDIGGWKTEDGKVIKQGLLYRGTELDGAVAPEYKLTDKGFSEMISILGIKTDMDLRTPTNSVPGMYILGAGVEHKYYSSPAYEDAFSDENKHLIKEIFSDLSHSSKYPIYLHCTYGMDRTGTICYILEALLGMSEDDLIRDYELSGLQNGGLDRDNILLVENKLKSYGGNNMQTNAERYLLSIGLTQNEIDNIKNIFLD